MARGAWDSAVRRCDPCTQRYTKEHIVRSGRTADDSGRGGRLVSDVVCRQVWCRDWEPQADAFLVLPVCAPQG